MRMLFVISLLGMAPFFLKGQCVWQWQNPELNKGDFLGVDAVTGNMAYAVGDQGNIAKTANGGRYWQEQKANTEVSLRAVHFNDTNTGWVVGRKGTVLHTIDGGKNWQTHQSFTQKTLHAVHSVNEQKLWVAGDSGTIFHSPDSGDSWTQQSSPVNETFKAIQFINPDTGWVVGTGGTILRTIDGGNSWQQQNSSTGKDLKAIHINSDQTGWVAGADGTILRTENGGKTWQKQHSDKNYTLTSLYVVDTIGLAVGYRPGNESNGIALQMKDGGLNWQIVKDSLANRFFAVDLTASGKGWMVGSNRSAFFILDAGRIFNKQLVSVTSNRLEAVHFADSQTGWAVGEFTTILRTDDGGRTWQNQNNSYAAHTLGAVHAINAQKAWIGVWYLSGIPSENLDNLLYTTNAGKTWKERIDKPRWLFINGISFPDKNNGWAVGYDTNIFHTSDGGKTWNGRSFTNGEYHDVHFPNTSNGWVVGKNGTILHTDNNGQDWYSQSGASNTTLNSVHFANNRAGWAVGNNGEILRTKNGGTDWKTLNSSTNSDLHDVHFVNKHTGWIVGKNGTILYTSDAGDNWQKQPDVTDKDLYGLHFLESNIGWAVGEAGTILKLNIQLPQAAFDYKVNGDSVSFTHNSDNEANITWLFREGDTIHQANPTRVYDSGGVYEVCLKAEKDCLWDTACHNIQIDGNTGINSRRQNPDLIQLYPNPVKDRVSLQFKLSKPTRAFFYLYNSNGQMVRELEWHATSGAHSRYISMDNLDEGMYLYKFKAGDLQQSGKFVHIGSK